MPTASSKSLPSLVGQPELDAFAAFARSRARVGPAASRRYLDFARKGRAGARDARG